MFKMQKARLDPLIQFDLQMKPPVPEHAIKMFKKPAAMKRSKWIENEETSIARQPMYINAEINLRLGLVFFHKRN